MRSSGRKKIGSGRHRPLRAKIRKAAIAVAQGKPVRVVMREIGYSDSTADKNQGALTEKPEFKEELASARAQIARSCKAHGVTIDRMVKKVSEGMEANKPMSGVGGMVLKLGKKEVKEFGHGNMMISDHEAQVKWWDRAAILLGIKSEDESARGA